MALSACQSFTTSAELGAPVVADLDGDGIDDVAAVVFNTQEVLAVLGGVVARTPMHIDAGALLDESATLAAAPFLGNPRSQLVTGLDGDGSLVMIDLAPGGPAVLGPSAGQTDIALIAGHFAVDGGYGLVRAYYAEDTLQRMDLLPDAGFTEPQDLSVTVPQAHPATATLGARPGADVAALDGYGAQVAVLQTTSAPLASVFELASGLADAGSTGIPAYYRYGLVAADLDGDGKSELVVYSPAGVAVLSHITEVHPAALALPFTGSSSPVAAAVADFDGDCVPDVVVSPASGPPQFFLGQGDGGFVAASSALSCNNHDVRAYAIGDFNHDGRPDLAATGSFSTLDIWFGVP